MSINLEIRNHFIDVSATQKIIDGVRTVSPIDRLQFNTGAGLAVIFLVQKVAQSIFFFACSMITLGLHEGFKTSLLKNAKEILTYSAAIPIGYAGIFFPQKINESILKIPSDGLIIV